MSVKSTTIVVNKPKATVKNLQFVKKLDNIIDDIKINGIKNIINCSINKDNDKKYKYIYNGKEIETFIKIYI